MTEGAKDEAPAVTEETAEEAGKANESSAADTSEENSAALTILASAPVDAHIARLNITATTCFFTTTPP